MTKKTAEVELHYERCCGLDIHKKLIVACFRDGSAKTVRDFGTTSKELRSLSEWLVEGQCEMVAMESTGSYWKPIFNVLELFDLNVMVVNAHHVKNVPGRKTDIKDAEWIARLLSEGLLKPSYVPDKEQRELRDITRYRKSLTEERAREINRLGKMLEGGNIKLTSVVTDVLGRSSRNLLGAVVEGEPIDEITIEGLITKQMAGKSAALVEAMDGLLSKTQRHLIRLVLDHIDDMARRIAELDDLIRDEMQKYEAAINLLDGIDGIGPDSARTILAEIGLDMDRFPTAGHLAAWAGLCPGNNESAGKRKNSATRMGNSALKTTLVQCAQSAVKKKGTFYRTQYDRLVVRRGKNRAKVAVAHSMIIAIWNILKKGVPFRDLGGDYYNRFNPEKKISMYLRKLGELGWEPSIPETA
jgi:transposase